MRLPRFLRKRVYVQRYMFHHTIHLPSFNFSLGEPFVNFMNKALENSSIACAMKNVYEAIKYSSIARITVHDFPLELQLPPYLDVLLHSDDLSDYESDNDDDDEFEHGEVQPLAPDMCFAWRLPALTPWKSLLRLDDQRYELYMKLRGPQLATHDRELAEQLIRFLDQASITLRFVPKN